MERDRGPPAADPIVEAHWRKQDAIRAAVDETAKRLVDQGKLIEAGWESLKMLSMPVGAPAIQIEEMRNAFFAGAQHLFGSMCSILDPDGDPTAADLRRMDLIADELEQFIKAYAQRHRPAGTA